MIKLGMNFFQTKYLFEYIRRGKTTTKYNQSGVHQCRERSEQIVSKSETFCKKAQRGKFSKPQLHALGRVFTGPTRIYNTQRHKEESFLTGADWHSFILLPVKLKYNLVTFCLMSNVLTWKLLPPQSHQHTLLLCFIVILLFLSPHLKLDFLTSSAPQHNIFVSKMFQLFLAAFSFYTNLVWQSLPTTTPLFFLCFCVE